MDYPPKGCRVWLCELPYVVWSFVFTHQTEVNCTDVPTSLWTIMQSRCVWLSCTCLTVLCLIWSPCYASGLPSCPTQTAAEVQIATSCSWQPWRASGAIKITSASSNLPLVLGTADQGTPTAPAAGNFHLTLQRLVIAGVKLTAPVDDGVPPLWPLGLFDVVGTQLNLSDVRLVVDAADLQQYLALMQTLPRAAAQFYTDGKSFLHIAAWEGRHSSVHSTTLISGSCLAADAEAYSELAAALEHEEPVGCNVRVVSNSTLIPTLLSSASLPTPQPLLVLVAANVSLGFGLKPGAIPINRPVVMVGLYSVPTSVDMYMVVNQLNVTGKYSKMYWLSLFIENAAPGDAISSLLSRPMSSAVSGNVYAMFCDRLHNCLNLHNSTVVLASQEEMGYVTYMYSMFNSPLPNMREATTFYHTELKCVVIQMGPGPGGIGMTLYNLTCAAWDIFNSVFTTQPAVAPRLPFPEGAPQITAATKAGPLVQSVKDCSSIQESMKFQTIESRLHVWMLLDNIDLAPDNARGCWQDRHLRYSTQIYGQSHESASSDQAHPAFTLAMGFLRDAIVLPPTADNKFLSIFNTTLTELPQGPETRASITPGRLPPDIFTVLMWSVSRNKGNADPLYIQYVTMWLPKPEWDFFAQRAAASSSFAVQLMGDDGDITFKGTTVDSDGVVKVQSYDGPGILGMNVQLRTGLDNLLPLDYYWPAAAGDGTEAVSGSGLAVGSIVGIALGSVAAMVLFVLVALAALHARQRRFKQCRLLPPPKAPTSTALSCKSLHSKSASQSSSPRQWSEARVEAGAKGVDISAVQDMATPLPVGGQGPALVSADSRTSRPASAAAASVATSSSAVAASLPSGGMSSSAAASSSSDSISLGLDRWKQAISTTTMQLMERRMQLMQAPTSGSSIRTPPGAGSRHNKQHAGARGLLAGGGNPQGPAGHMQQLSSKQLPQQEQQTGLQIHQLIGQGSFGSVWLGTWHGKRVAVKIMQLPAGGPLGTQTGGQQNELMAQNQANSPPHMAVMEAVVSCAVSHPNITAVYTYMLQPLAVGSHNERPLQPETGDPAAGPQGPAQGVQPYSRVTGWRLSLIMEYCNAGTLREALDRHVLHNLGAIYLPRESILALAHDVAAALLHLHGQGVVHGDLKAANVMLTQTADDHQGVWAPAFGHKVTAKCCDFGLSIPLNVSDTHATLAARVSLLTSSLFQQYADAVGTPSHMSPELFLSGHVSKASDVYALGILLYELITSTRPFGGVPVPLLPHEVAVKGSRPQWPPQLPQEYKDLQALAEACWVQVPQDRPTIAEIFDVLELLLEGKPALHLLPRCQAGLLHQQEQQRQQPSVQQPVAPQNINSQPGQECSQDPAGQQELQQQARPGLTPQGAGNNAVARKGMSWSEVTFVSPS